MLTAPEASAEPAATVTNSSVFSYFTCTRSPDGKPLPLTFTVVPRRLVTGSSVMVALGISIVPSATRPELETEPFAVTETVFLPEPMPSSSSPLSLGTSDGDHDVAS